jgi:hypothetical protein
MNLNVTPASQGFGGSGATGGGDSPDPVADAAHGSGDLTPEPDFAAGARGCWRCSDDDQAGSRGILLTRATGSCDP